MDFVDKLIISMTLLLVLATNGIYSQNVGGGNIILTGFRMRAGVSLANKPYTFVMQEDCNLVLYGPSGPTWASGTNGKGSKSCYVILQSDGNLVVYNESETPVWSSGKFANPAKGPFYLKLQPTGSVQILYATEQQPQEVLWSIP